MVHSIGADQEEVFITGQIKENLNQVFSRYTRGKYLVLKAIKVDTHTTAKYTRLRKSMNPG